MAMTKCRECGREISTEAAACPHCGAPTGRAAKRHSGCAIVIAAALLALVYAMLSGYCSRPPDEEAAAADTTFTAPPAPARQLAAKVISIDCNGRNGMTVMKVTVQNTGDTAIPYAKVFADFSSSAGIVASEDSYFSPTEIPPGARASADLYVRRSDVTNCQVRAMQDGDGTAVALTPPG